MQFPVPQFTDVEDKIIGPLTVKQFGIIFATGVIIFLGYSATKSVLVLVFLFVLFGIPALGLAFAKINGRPLYNTIGNFVKFLSSPKILIFHKEAYSLKTVKDAQLATPVKVEAVPREDTQAHLKQVQEMLTKTAGEEKDLADRMK
jgi:predicted transcriptional regulator